MPEHNKPLVKYDDLFISSRVRADECILDAFDNCLPIRNARVDFLDSRRSRLGVILKNGFAIEVIGYPRDWRSPPFVYALSNKTVDSIRYFKNTRPELLDHKLKEVLEKHGLAKKNIAKVTRGYKVIPSFRKDYDGSLIETSVTDDSIRTFLISLQEWMIRFMEASVRETHTVGWMKERINLEDIPMFDEDGNLKLFK